MRQQHVRPQCDQLPDQRLDSIKLTPSPSNIDLEIASLDPTELLEIFPEADQAWRRLAIPLGVADQHADPAHTFAALGSRCKRRQDRAADKLEKLASPHQPLARHCASGEL
jgi:hypothetical protein